MTEFTMRIAGRVAAVSAAMPSTRDYCRDFLCQGPADIAIRLTPEDISNERVKAAREDQLEGIPPRKFSDAYLETIALQRKLAEALFAFDTLLFHGSVVAVDGVGYLFTAKSGTGKSTHTRLWREVFGPRAVMINDDKPFLQVTEEGIMACGSPWNGKHGLGCNASVPLHAICLLQRGEANHIQMLSPRDVVVTLVQQSNRPMDVQYMPKYLELIDALAQKVQFYRLTCNMEHEAALTAYAMMKAGKDDE